ncbi:heme transporter FLVCR1-like [Cloeon dipterum]|uniref:heme transporter FLVCR1-like n=1 Tax=Cloeon dipterum TaxID=197152 RepID=UPI0032200C95
MEEENDEPEEKFKVKLELRPEEGQPLVFAVYKRRWAMLALFIAYAVPNSFQVFQYSIVTDEVMQFYNVQPIAVNWTATVYMLANVVAIFPSTWFYNRMGLRVSLLLAMGGTCLGAWIKVISVSPDRFWVAMLGQTISALCSSYVLNIQVPLAATWFGPKEVSTACSIGTLGAQIGGALGFLLPVALIPEDGDAAAIEWGFYYIAYGLAIFCTLAFILQLIFLESEPPTPPGNAQAIRARRRESVLEYLKSQFRLLFNLNFVLVFLSYGINLAVFSAVGVFLSLMIVRNFPVWLVQFVFSVFPDEILISSTSRQQFTGTNLIIFFSTDSRFNLIVFFSIAIVGYWPAAFEFAAELTYPEPEASSAAMMIFGGQILSVLFTLAYGWLFVPFGDLASNLFMTGLLVVGVVLTFFVKSDLKRQQAEKANNPAEAVQNERPGVF